MDEINMPSEYDKLNDKDKEYLINWIRANLSSRKSFNPHYSSYGLKHFVPEYYSNGAFKGAMLVCGYNVKDKSALNWCFNVSERSPILIRCKNGENVSH